MRNFYDRINSYRVMWVIVMYDLPMVSEVDKKRYQVFRKRMLLNGFEMFQFSMYVRFCASKENAEVHVKRVKAILPVKGNIGIFMITDRQFGMLEVFHGRQKVKGQAPPQQLEMF